MPYILKYFGVMALIKMKNWLVVLTRPLETLQIEFWQFGLLQLDDAKTTSQVMLFEKMLNKRFSPSNLGIYITNNINLLQPVYLHTRQEQQPAPRLYTRAENQPLYVYTRQEYDLDVDFTIHIPLLYVQNTPENIKKIQAYADKFVLAGINYKILYY